MVTYSIARIVTHFGVDWSFWTLADRKNGSILHDFCWECGWKERKSEVEKHLAYVLANVRANAVHACLCNSQQADRIRENDTAFRHNE